MSDNTEPLKTPIPDRYEILVELGSGGMGAVYKVHDEVLNKNFALKILKSVGHAGSSEIIRFQKEAKAVASLQHKNIVDIIDFGFHEKATPYMVLEFVEGVTLKDYLKKKGPLSVQEAIVVFHQIADALSHAHEHKIIHRDLKSDNILITKDKDEKTVVKLFDFGIARIAESLDTMKLTATNAIIGTPSIMSPEQVRGEKVDARSDIYSFGCVMFQSLTGRMPFVAKDTFKLLEMHKDTVAPKVGSIVSSLKGSHIEAIVAKCLEKDPEERFQSAVEVSESLEAEDESPIAENVLATTHESKSAVFSYWQIGLAIVGFVILSAVTFGLINSSVKQEPQSVIQKPDRVVKHSEPTEDRWENARRDLHEGLLNISLIKDFKDDDISNISNLQIDPASITQVDCSNPRYVDANLGTFATARLSDTGFQNLLQLSNIRNLTVRDNYKITDKAIESLSKLKNLAFFDAKNSIFENAKSLSKLTHLKSVGLNKTTADELLALQKLPIENILLQDVKVDGAMIDALCKLKLLTSLVLDTCDNIDGKSLKKLNKLTNCKMLSIENSSGVNDEVIDSITTLKNVNVLILKGDKVSDDKVARIAKMHWLSSLDLETNSDLTDTSLQYLSKITGLRKLVIHNCPNITKKAIENFEKNTLCEVKAKSKEYADYVDADKIVLPSLNSLKESGSTPTDPTEPKNEKKNSAWNIADTTHVPTVHLVNIKGFKPNDLAHLPESVHEVDITGLEPSDELFNNIANCKSLTDIKMHSMSPISSAHISALKRLPRLSFITANKTSFEDASGLSQLKNLENLSLSWMTPEQIASFSALPKLTTLSLENSALTKKMAVALSSLKGLTKMELRNVNPVERGAFSSVASIKNLRNVTINGTPTMKREDIRFLSQLKLHKLELRRDDLTDEDLKQLSQMTTLTHLDISDNKGFKDESLTYFYSTPKLIWLRVVDCGFKRDAKQMLIEQRKSKGEFKLIVTDKKVPFYK